MIGGISVNRFIENFVKICIPASLVTILLLVLMIEVWVRFSWNPRKGTPGLVISSPSRIEQFAPHYVGWYGGVVLRTNNLGFRDSRDYPLEKNPRVFRILILGDSVTFGYGSIYEHTYPYLLESKLKSWKSNVEWQVWNLGVPGYNTSHELAYFNEVGPSYQPDLVVVGFYPNDVIANPIFTRVTPVKAFVSRVKSFLKAHFYSYDFYKRAYLQFYWKLLGSDYHRRLLGTLAREESLLARVDEVQDLEEQKISPVEPLKARHLMRTQCRAQIDPQIIERIRHDTAWHNAVKSFQQLHKQGTYRIIFFVNIAPDVCAEDDVFYHGERKLLNDYFIGVLSNGTPVVSSYDSFYQYRPSQMPVAGGHSLGNSNLVKAETLFQYLKDQVFPLIPRFTSN
jgi:hypothetical protein